MRKRLVVCCDGTWNRPDSAIVTNVEKIARTISTRETDDGVHQQVLYLSGVGTNGYAVDRILGGAFGLGLFDNIRTAYRWLALNYDPGDEIFVFGFSRGAYTARSLVGMIGRVGLLTRQSLISEHLPEAVDRYRRQPPSRTAHFGCSDERFREVNSHRDTTVRFLGVFDTVGALGVPGAFRRGHQFHDVKLSAAVQCARQALAVDEHRMKFEPSLWQPLGGEPVPSGDSRVKQVWFEGAHSDVGGGYADCGLSDTALEWMTDEAIEQGLVFDEALRLQYVGCGSAAIRHESLTPMYRLLNVTSRVRLRVKAIAGGRRDAEAENAPFVHGQRVLGRRDAVAIRVAGSTSRHFDEDRSEREASASLRRSDARRWYRPRNLEAYAEGTGGFQGVTETILGRPRRPT
jgi:uncharacterized protein (DUF2235 family)